MIDPKESNVAYHNNPAIGSGDVRKMKISARLCRDGLDGLCDRETRALLFGIASHLCLLEPERFAAEAAIKPEGMKFSTKDGMNWRDAQVGKVIVTHDDAIHLKRMQERMPDEVRAIFSSCQKEVTVRTEIDGLAVQCRPDLWDIERRRKHDLKTIACIDNMERAIRLLRYDIQDRFYDLVIQAETGHRCDHSSLIFAETTPPYRWRIVELDLDYQALADKDIDDALASIRARMKSGCWEDEGAIRKTVSPPEWLMSDLYEDAGGIHL